MEKEPDIQFQESQRVTNKTNPKRSKSRHNIIKMVKVKEKKKTILKAARQTRITTGCWTIIDRKTLDFTKEDTPRPRTEEKPQ